MGQKGLPSRRQVRNLFMACSPKFFLQFGEYVKITGDQSKAIGRVIDFLDAIFADGIHWNMRALDGAF